MEALPPNWKIKLSKLRDDLDRPGIPGLPGLDIFLEADDPQTVWDECKRGTYMLIMALLSPRGSDPNKISIENGVPCHSVEGNAMVLEMLAMVRPWSETGATPEGFEEQAADMVRRHFPVFPFLDT